MITLLLASLAFAGDSIVAAGNGLVAGPPEGFVKPAGATSGTWVSVLADCLEEARPGAFSVVDRSREGVTTEALAADVGAIREFSPAAVVVGVGANDLTDDADLKVLASRLTKTVSTIRAKDGPAVLLVGVVSPTLAQLEWKDDADLVARQAAMDARAAAWNDVLSRLADADDGVWMVDLAWPSDPAGKQPLTQGGWALTDRAHARIGAVICEELLKNLKNGSK